MARFGLLCLLAAALGGVAASPVEEQQLLGNPSSLTLDKKWDWQDCGSASHIIHIKSIQVSPDPPQRGQELTITVEGDAAETIEDGAYADVTVKVGVIKILSKEFDICEEADKANTTVQCPVQKGAHKVIQSVELPKEIPPAQFKVNIRAYTVDDEDLACMDLMMDFRPTRGSFLNW
ncbi:Phosphatidylglycerol/phosphatidylinositol transfer protein [Trametes pubescens]|uniref:Phosphatidylglycerol/phosphatidylinositol transfer protein n=1 Tax=Trametes pubescens TaxID=154538 RepID=A0A1M2V604_TRAPU|nr:Phosphatidylglycerol/phosphatidylinositol transfer protein [Trametes pubescens]